MQIKWLTVATTTATAPMMTVNYAFLFPYQQYVAVDVMMCDRMQSCVNGCFFPLYFKSVRTNIHIVIYIFVCIRSRTHTLRDDILRTT